MMSNWITRKNTKTVDVGGVLVGNNNPISVQSMTNTNTCDVLSTINQINDLQAAGADIVRVSVPGFDEAAAFKEIRKSVDIPLVADIHFDYKIALEVADTADCLRINPGNIGKEDRIAEVINAAKYNNVPIRVGVNAGSLEKDLQKKYGEPNADALVESALRHVDILDKFNFDNYKMKAIIEFLLLLQLFNYCFAADHIVYNTKDQLAAKKLSQEVFNSIVNEKGLDALATLTRRTG